MPSNRASSAAEDLAGLSLGDDALPPASDQAQPNGLQQAEDSHVPGKDLKAEQPPPPNLNEKEGYHVRTDVASDEETPHHGTFDSKSSTNGSVEESKEEEIQSIMEQFGEEQGTELSSPPVSPNRELPVFHYPPRSSSLDYGVISGPLASDPTSSVQASRDPDTVSLSYTPSIRSQPPPPEPDPEPDLPFDFHRFLEQLRHRTADPVAKFLRSFLQEFGKKQWQAHEQVKIIGDFLTFIANKMAQCEVWRTVSDAEFENAKEGMEKLVMNRLYGQTFSPEIPAGEPSPLRGGRRRGAAQPLGPGRRGQHQEDIERDDVLAQKIRIYGWIREGHLDIKPCNEKGKRFLVLAQQELAKIKNYRAPRDKVICVLNSCKVIMGYLRNADSDQSADSFIPLLIYTVLKAKPDHLVSNVQYIQRFRNPDKLSGEAGYYMSSLIGAVQFIENLDRTNLTVSEEEFDQHVEAAVSELAKHQEQAERRLNKSSSSAQTKTGTSPPKLSVNEKSLPSRPGSSQSNSLDNEKPQSSSEKSLPPTRIDGSSEASDASHTPAVTGLLRTIQKPLSTIGRIFSDEGSIPSLSALRNTEPSNERPLLPDLQATPAPTASSPPRNSRLHPHARERQRSYQGQAQPPMQRPEDVLDEDPNNIMEDDAAALRASAEAAEAYRIMQAEHGTVVDTLAGMFPDLDRDIIGDVVRMKDGNVGLAVDACLQLAR